MERTGPLGFPWSLSDLIKTYDFTNLIHAVSRGDINEVQRLLPADVPVEIEKHHLDALLHRCHKGEITGVLLSHGADVNRQNSYGKTLLERAILNRKDVDFIRELLKHGAYVNVPDYTGSTPLIQAIQQNDYYNLEVVKELLKYGAAVNVSNFKGQTPLFLSIRHNQSPELVTLLLEHGADVCTRNHDNLTPLHVAITSSKHLEVIQDLLKYGADVNATDNEDETPLHFATYCDKNLEVVKELLKYGACLNVRSDEGITPLHLAAISGGLKIVRELLNHHAEVNMVDFGGDTALHNTVIFPKNVDIVKELLRHGACVNMLDNRCETPLHMAVRCPTNSGAVKVLLKYGSEVNIANCSKETPLHLVLRHNVNVKIVQQLLRYGSHINACDAEGKTPLHLAAQKLNLKIVRELLNHGADICATDKAGATPIYYAVRNNNRLRIVKTMVRYANIAYQFSEELEILPDEAIPYLTYLKIFEELIKHGTYNNHTLERYGEHLDFAVKFDDIACAKLLIKYALIQKASNHGGVNLNAYKRSKYYGILFRHLDKCLGEISQMKAMKIKPKLSLYEFVTTRNINVALYPDNKSTKSVTEIGSLIANYPIYSNVISPKVHYALRRAVQLNKVSEMCMYISANERMEKGEIALNYYCKSAVAKFLSNDDLQNLIKAYTRPELCVGECISWLFE